MVAENGNITNRTYEWLERGFASGSYVGRHRKNCSKKSRSKDKNCPWDWKKGLYKMAARDSRPELACGEGQDFNLSSYNPCATTLDAKAYQPRNAKRLLDE